MNYWELLKNILKKGSVISPRGEETKELNCVTLNIERSHNMMLTENARSFRKCFPYQKAELAWYVSGERNVDFINNNSKDSMWKEIANFNKTLNSNYGNLVYYRKAGCDENGKTYTSFEWCFNNLKRDENTRDPGQR